MLAAAAAVWLQLNIIQLIRKTLLERKTSEKTQQIFFWVRSNLLQADKAALGFAWIMEKMELLQKIDFIDRCRPLIDF